MINALLFKFGYVRYSSLNESELSELYHRHLKLDEKLDFTKEIEEELFNQLKNTENFSKYLKASANLDVQRYFSAQTDTDRAMARGAFARTMYLLGRLVKSDSKTKDKKGMNLRYG